MTEAQKFDITLQGPEASAVFLEPVFRDESIASNFMVMGNVTGGSKYIKYQSAMANILRKYQGCGFNPSTVPDFTQKLVYLEKMAGDVEFCWDDFSDILWESVYKQRGNWTDITGTVVQEIIAKNYATGIANDIARLAYFGDKTSALDTFDLVDGMWSVIYPREKLAGRTTYTNIAAAAISADGSGISSLKAVYDAQSTVLYATPDEMKVFNVSRSVYDRYRSDMELVGYNVENNASILMNGMPVLKYRGIDVVCNPMWGAWAAAADAGAGTFAGGVNLIELTARFNKVLLSNINGVDYSMDIWYNKEDEKVKIKSRPKLGFDIIHGAFASVSYYSA